jgi:hypothetical protein
MNKQSGTTLSEQSKAVQLAVDLIQLLEENAIDNQVALDALAIVINDFQQKVAVDNLSLE